MLTGFKFYGLMLYCTPILQRCPIVRWLIGLIGVNLIKLTARKLPNQRLKVIVIVKYKKKIDEASQSFKLVVCMSEVMLLP